MALNRTIVLEGAVRLADEKGLDALTMRSLGAALGVEAMSLYNHVRGKPELLDGMVDVIFDEIAQPSDDLDWRMWLRQRAESVREVLRRHRWAIGLLESRTAPGPATLRHHDSVLGCLRRAGFSVRSAGHVYALLDSYVYGFALQEVNLPSLAPDSPDMDKLMDAVRSADYPHLIEFAMERVVRSGYDFGDEFDIGLEMVLDAAAELLGE